MSKTSRQINKQKSSLLIIILIVIAAGAGFILFKTFFTSKNVIEPDDQFTWENPLKEIEELKNQTTENPVQPDKEPSPPEPASPAVTPPSPCARVSENLTDFFSNLQEQDYIRAYEIKEPLQEYSNKLIIKLLNNPPIINEETDDLFTVLKNTAHFYRVLGHKDMSLIKDMLAYEHANIEHLMGIFWEWSQIANTCNDTKIQMNFPLPKLYEYASFFLNTLGGQSYLFRRNSNMRVLIKYYCMLILDQAVTNSLNKYNIDEIYTLDSVIEDIENTDTIENQKDYLANLMQIKARVSMSR
nr:hypothetical protein [Desulfobulbaceae bacterium]